MSTMTGGCLCGQLRYEISGQADCTVHCHCRACRRTTGAAISTWTTVAIENFHVTQGEPETYSSTDKCTRQFCPVWGSQIAFQHEEYEGYVDVAVGSLDNPDTMPPERHLWFARQISWTQIDSHLPKAQEA